MSAAPQTRLAFDIASIGLLAPGLPSWDDSLAVLRGEQPHTHAPMPARRPTCLSGGELRRLPPQVRAALWVAEQACAGLPDDQRAAETVFCCGQGDLETTHYMATTLVASPASVSPTKFANSVHNAAAGHWTIAAQATAASTAVCSEAWSAGASVLDAVTRLAMHQHPILLVAYDSEAPTLIDGLRPMPEPFFCALMLVPGDRYMLEMTDSPDAISHCAAPGLEQLRSQNFIAQLLPLLQLHAGGRSDDASVHLPASRGLGLALTRNAA